VLAKFDKDEHAIVEDAVVRAADASEAFIEDGIQVAMNRFNVKKDDGKPETGNGKLETGSG